MRDPQRIPRLLSLLAQYWEKHPDFRLAQIVCNLADQADPYFVEDDHYIKHLEQLIERDESFSH